MMEISRDTKLRLLLQMLRIRRFEEHVKEYFLNGLVPGATHLYIGQEACAVGVCENLRTEDYITSTHRGHGHCIAKGGRLDLMMAELFGKATGYCGGKGGSMHIADIHLGILGANGIVGGGLPIAVGAGLSVKTRGTNQVVVSFFGDGASNQGSFHESLNMAAVLKLPVVFVCENNQYAVSTSVNYSCPVEDIAGRSRAYGMPGEVADGNDVIEVCRASAECIERARRREGPSLLELKTYRVEGHYVGDSCKYRDQEETAEVVQARDPIARLLKQLSADGVDAQATDGLDQQVQEEIAAADKFATESPEPDLESVLEGVYV